MGVKKIEKDSLFREILNLNSTKLVVAGFYAIWCPTCKQVEPDFEKLSNKYDRALFLEVYVDKCPEIVPIEGVSTTPTFILYRNKLQVAKIQGANIAAVEVKIMDLYEASHVAAVDDCGVPGHMDLSSFIIKRHCEALNDSDEHPLPRLFENSGYIESDCDQQLILSLVFKQPVRVHSIKVS